MTQVPSGDPARVSPDTRALFIAFLKVGVSGFGGVMPFAHRMLVERERWLDEREFIDVLSLCQFLPGPNIVNMSIVVGRRFDGARGALVSALGLIVAPMIIILVLGALYRVAGGLPFVKGAFGGVACAAAGLVLAMAMRMGRSLRGSVWQIVVAVLAFVAIAVLRWPLVWVLLGIIPLALLLARHEQVNESPE
ncbi:MAG: chromate transporter [Pseudomonadota bacterium]|nr:chromate transporter [Pseudomonadota bacterium]